MRYWVVGGQPALRRGEALWHLLTQNLTARGIAVRYGKAAKSLTTSDDGCVTGAVVTSDDSSNLVSTFSFTGLNGGVTERGIPH